MTYKRTNTLSNLYLYTIILSGLVYSAFLSVVANKIVPGFIMQVIFLFDSLKFNTNLFHLVFSQMFLLNTTSGLILITLFYSYIKAILFLVKSILTTRKVINNYQLVKITDSYKLYRSTENQIFTAGLLKPKIYVSTGLFRSHSKAELEAMIFHEKNHQNNFHPLKTLSTRFIQLLLPPMPGKNWLIDNYTTLTEVSSDQFAEYKIESKIPLVSALLKYQNPKPNPLLATVSNYFNSQSERIKILVGQKKQAVSTPLVYAFMVSILMFLSIGYFNNTSIFFNCHHLIDCLKVLVTPNSQPLLTSLNTNIITTPLVSSDHCQ